jgi:DNA glycosylase AlkZ-like
VKSFTWYEVCARRLARNYLTEPAERNAIPLVTSVVCGVQAQIMSAAGLALGARVTGATLKDVEDELWNRRRIVKTIGPRETLHLLSAEKLSIWMAAMRARHSLYESYWYEKAGLEPAQAEVLLEAIGQTLDGRCLTREQLAEEAARRAGSWTKEKLESPWGNLLGPAAFTGLLCFGPSQGNKVTFVRADQWVADDWREIDPGEALKEVCRCYLAAYGPARYQGFAHWFGLKPVHAHQVVEALSSELVEVEVEGKRAWMLANDRDTNTPDTGSLRLLPQYDCYILGCGERERIVPESARKRISTYGRGRFEGATGLPVLLLDGVVAGIWERKSHGKRIDLRVEPFIEITSDQRHQLEAEAQRVGEFFEGEVSLSIGILN